ncbi:hypothetical protein [Chengkuizengella axinellae]|uniref:DUF4363 family protein n=1 Tax=Chengkuizengella axinellae TaxID=3064388 RepID=A0ABT9J4E7_9BACL|nr:hypothetical protein [Chengkuizengella sp. 2205SS18-9]MDP5276474.1 hypothetical protein [Chengkuizengella sp. 2205SS18-9]
MDTTWIIMISLAVLGAVIYLFPYLKQKGYITQETMNLADQILLFSKIIISKNSNENDKDKLENIFDTIRKDLNDLNHISNSKSLDEKKQLTLHTIIANLNSLEIEIDYENELLIEMIVDNALNFIK